jgi:ArsR family transcriptional regulator
MISRDYVLAPQVVQVDFSLAPVLSVFESMELLTEVEQLSGLADWVIQTAAKMPLDKMWTTRLVFNALYMVVFQPGTSAPDHEDFSLFVRALAEQNPYDLVERVWDKLAAIPTMYAETWPQDKPVPAREQIMSSRESYADFMNVIHRDCANETLWGEAYDLLQDPPRLLAMTAEHLQALYDDYVRPEWERVLPMLQESVAAFQKLDYSNMTVYEAIRAVTGRDMTGKMDGKLENAERLVFVPTAHIGPYVGKFLWNDTLYILFGARLPRGVPSHSSDLSRAELLIRLNALGDDTRLRILELLTHQDELCAQDIIERLGLSQPTISRHLSQLSATGYITERRRDVGKCYSLNTDRVMDTLRALTNFLSRQ